MLVLWCVVPRHASARECDGIVSVEEKFRQSVVIFSGVPLYNDYAGRVKVLEVYKSPDDFDLAAAMRDPVSVNTAYFDGFDHWRGIDLMKGTEYLIYGKSFSGSQINADPCLTVVEPKSLVEFMRNSQVPRNFTVGSVLSTQEAFGTYLSEIDFKVKELMPSTTTGIEALRLKDGDTFTLTTKLLGADIVGHDYLLQLWSPRTVWHQASAPEYQLAGLEFGAAAWNIDEKSMLQKLARQKNKQ